MACLDADTAAAYAAHALEPEEARGLEEHIDTCSSCRELVSMVAKAGWSRSTASAAHTVGSSPGLRGEGGPAAQPVLPRGTRIGPFEIDAPLDAGGMGLVYAAHDVRLDRRVALKCLRERRGSPEQLLREAKLMAQLANPNVVPVYDVIEAHGQVFIAMELVVGRSLRQWMEAGPRGWRAVVDAFLEAGAGLAAAHAAGIVHGDVKPANILVGDDGRVRVTDFGLASLVSEHAGEAGSVRGTPAYLAPEQWAGRPCDALGDQYAFCVSLHEALTGALPGARTARLAGLPRGVRRVLARGLLPDPARRYPSMQALLGALRAARSARWRWALGAAAVTAASVGVAFVFGVRQVEAEQCEVAASELASPWDAEAKARLRDAFERTKLPYASETVGKVVARLDGWSAGFEEARQRACAAGWFRRETPLERLPGQLSCLKDRVREVRALVSQMYDANPTVVQSSVSATELLTPVERCAQAAPQRAASLDSPEANALREQFATVGAMMSSGKYRRALELAKQVMKDAEALGDTRLLATARMNLGASHVWMDDYEAGTPNLLEAIRLADIAQDDRLRAQAWTSLLQAEYRQGHYDKVLFMMSPALGACERLGDAWHHSELFMYQGGALSQLGKLKEAQQAFERAVQMRVKVYGERDYRTSFALSGLGNALAMQGELEGGIDAHRRALAVGEAALGARHPNIGTLHGNLGTDYLYGLQAREAIEELEKSLAIAESVQAPRQLNVARALNGLGYALLEAGEPQRALERFEKAEAMWRTAAPKHPSHAECLLGRNLAARALGRPVSLEELEKAVALSQGGPGFIRGRMQLELALALPPGKVSPRAMALVKEAKAGLSTSTLPLVQRELGRANDWLRAHGAAP